MKIGIIVPNVGMSEEQLEERLTFLKRISNPGTEIEMIKNTDGPLSIESEFEHQEASVQIIKTIMRLKAQDYDAFIPWCGGDPGITAGREVTAVPVVGPFQSSCSIAILLGYKFSIITPSTNPRLIEERLQSLHLRDRLASIRMLNIPVLELRQDISKTINVLKEIVKRTIQDDQADVIILSCLGLFGIPSQLKGAIQVPIIDPALAAVKMAETIVTMGLRQSKIAYPYPKGLSL